MAKQTPAKKTGRKRDTQVDENILTTALKLLVEQGYARTSIEKIALEAGVGKTSIYRRYKNKQELFAAAVSSIVQDVVPPPDTGSTYSDLVGALQQFRDYAQSKGLYSIMGTLLLETERNPELVELFREKIIDPRRLQIKTTLQRGINGGEIQPDVSIDSAMDTLFGAFITRFLAGEPADDTWITSVVDIVWRGIS